MGLYVVTENVLQQSSSAFGQEPVEAPGKLILEQAHFLSSMDCFNTLTTFLAEGLMPIFCVTKTICRCKSGLSFRLGNCRCDWQAVGLQAKTPE